MLLILLFIPMLACNQKRIREQTSKLHKQNQSEILIGEWMIFSWGSIQKINDSVSTELAAQCNACPYITFKKNGSGVIKRPDQKRFEFIWSTQGDKLSFKNVGPEAIIRSGNYRVLRGKSRTIKLLDSVRKIFYNLGHEDIE